MVLTAKQRRFIDEYLAGDKPFNATAAAIAAGYSEKTASVIGHENLRKPNISAEIERRLTELTMSANEVLLRTADIARGNLAEWIDDDGAVDIAAMRAAGKGHLIKKFKHTRRVTTSRMGSETETTTTEMELYPADAAHDKLMRYHGLYNDKMRVETWQDEVVALLKRGDIAPDDVRAAYPELAAEFFARAGMAVEADADD